MRVCACIKGGASPRTRAIRRSEEVSRILLRHSSNLSEPIATKAVVRVGMNWQNHDKPCACLTKPSAEEFFDFCHYQIHVSLAIHISLAPSGIPVDLGQGDDSIDGAGHTHIGTGHLGGMSEWG